MRYASDDGKIVEWIWNSRDGVVPFCVRSRCGVELRHVHWAYDVRVVDYPTLPGERIFVDATPELARPKAEEATRNHLGPSVGGEDFERAVQETIHYWLNRPGTPWLIEVGGTYENETVFRKAIAAARREASKAGGMPPAGS